MAGLFSKPKIPEPAAIEPVKIMPLPDDEAVKKAKKTATTRQRQRQGRASTILSDAGELTSLGEA